MKNFLTFCVAGYLSLWVLYSQAETAHRFFYSADQQEVVDSKTSLIWRRCVEGMSWNGISCIGSEKTFTYREAVKHTADISRLTGVDWRLPEADEIISIAQKSGIKPEVFEEFFPATPPTWYWSSSPVTGAENYLLAVGFCDDASGHIEVSGTNQYYLRLVRTYQDL